MSRRKIGSVAVVLLVLLAGCSGATGGGNSASTATTTDTPEPYVSSGEDLNASKLMHSHVKTMKKSESFTVREATTIKSGNGSDSQTLSMEGVTKVDFKNKVYYQERNTSFGNVEKYTDASAGKTYTKFTLGNKTSVRVASKGEAGWKKNAVSPKEAISKQMLVNTVGNVTYSVDGVTTYNDTSVTRLTANGSDAYPALKKQLGENQTLKSFKSTLLIANDKEYVRYFSITIEIYDKSKDKTMTATLTMAYDNVGETVIEEPQWVTKKKQSQTETSN